MTLKFIYKKNQYDADALFEPSYSKQSIISYLKQTKAILSVDLNLSKNQSDVWFPNWKDGIF
jgi:hypothetical protein